MFLKGKAAEFFEESALPGDSGRGLSSGTNSFYARQMERRSHSKQLEPTTLGLKLCASPVCPNKGALGLTQPVPSQMGQWPTFQLTQMSVFLRQKLKKCGFNQSGFESQVLSRPWQGDFRSSEQGPLITPKGAERSAASVTQRKERRKP